MAEAELYRREPLELIKSGLLSIRTKSGELQAFFPNFAQRIVIAKIEKRISENKPVRIRLLKARQLGFSTLFEAIIYVFTSRRQGFHSLVIAHDEDGSKGLFEMNKLFHETLDPAFKPALKKSNEIALEFEGLKSKIDIDTSRNKSAGRSHTYQMVHKSESAFFAFPKEVNLGIANTVPDLPGTMIFDETTANGMNFYYDDVNKSIQCLDGFDFIFIPWVMNPEYKMPAPKMGISHANVNSIIENEAFSDDVLSTKCPKTRGLTKSEIAQKLDFDLTEEEAEVYRISLDVHKIDLSAEQLSWRRYAIAHKCGGDIDLFHQEYPLTVEEAFIFSGRPRFDVNMLRQLKAKAIRPIAEENLLRIYEQPEAYSKYIIGADTSEGLATGDNSSVTVINTRTFKQAAKYSGKLAPDLLASYIKLWAEKYNDALAVVESNNHGLVTLNYLKEIYSRVYYRKVYDKVSDIWTEKIGWQTSSRTKPLLISALDKALRAGLGVSDSQTIDELMTYVIEEDGATNASEGKKDDDVISLALAVQGYNETAEHTVEPPPQRKSLYLAPVDEDQRAAMEEMENGG